MKCKHDYEVLDVRDVTSGLYDVIMRNRGVIDLNGRELYKKVIYVFKCNNCRDIWIQQVPISDLCNSGEKK